MALGPFSNAKWRVRRSQRALGPRPCEGSFALLPCPRVLTTATRNESLNLPVSLQDFEAEAGKAAPVDFLPVHMKQNIKKPPPPRSSSGTGQLQCGPSKGHHRGLLCSPLFPMSWSLSLSLSPLGPAKPLAPCHPAVCPARLCWLQLYSWEPPCSRGSGTRWTVGAAAAAAASLTWQPSSCQPVAYLWRLLLVAIRPPVGRSREGLCSLWVFYLLGRKQV